MSRFAFGQYYPTESFIHKMDATVKILCLIAYIVLVFIVKNFYGYIVIASLVLLSVQISKVPLHLILKSMKAILFVVFFTAILNLFTYTCQGEKIIFKWWKLKLTDKSINFSVFMFLRLTLLFVGTQVLTLTTTPVALTDGIEVLLYPLKLLKVPIDVLALIISIALRLIPTLTEETEKIMNAQKARGADFENGSLLSRIKALVPILIPLLVSSFRRSNELGDAMDSRCYMSGQERTKYKKTVIGFRDIIGVLTVTICFVGVIILNAKFISII